MNKELKELTSGVSSDKQWSSITTQKGAW